VEIIGLTKEVKELAIELRRSHRLRLPDAIVAASALVYDAVLLSNDQQLSRVSGLKLQSVRLK
jgi:predicted nucleic acid-binding protein